MATVRPDLAAQWHPYKNGVLTPNDVCVFSNKAVWWYVRAERCGKIFDLEWKALVSNRANGSGCPFTSVPPRKLLKGFNDLASTNPALAAKWHPAKNGDLTPDMVFEHSGSKVWWRHLASRFGKTFEHVWEAAPRGINRSGAGCPICHGTQVMAGYNDLTACFPDIALEWDDEKNAPLQPQEISYGSSRLVAWICSQCGHRWTARVINRTMKHTSCPACARRSQTSFPEQAVYFYLSQQFDGCINRDREALGGMELDIYLPRQKLAVEYSGLFAHGSSGKQAADEKKRVLCVQNGITLLSIEEHPLENSHDPDSHRIFCVPKQDYSHLGEVMDCLSRELMSGGHLAHPIQVDLKRDEPAIRAQYQRARIAGSMAVTHPELLAEWDYERNGALRPACFSAGSNVVVHWRHEVVRSGISYLHRWSAPVQRRTAGRGCPICAGKVIQAGFNDFFSNAPPQLLDEWDQEANQIFPREVTAHSHRAVAWKHQVVRGGKTWVHRWTASVDDRMGNKGCPICAGKVIQRGFNDLAATCPALLAEWDEARNRRSPDSVSYGSVEKVFWKHEVWKNGVRFEHVWSASPNSRTNRRSGCPYCANKKVLAGFNDLQTLLPEIASQWDDAGNAPLTPKEVTVASTKQVWWLDRTKPARICDRTKYLRRNGKSFP